MLDFIDVPAEAVPDLREFAELIERHPWGRAVEGRLVVAEPVGGTLQSTIRAVLEKWMKPDEFREWEAEQVARPVATAGKTFVASDEVLTAVVPPVPDMPLFLGLAGHEIVELATQARGREDPPAEDAGVHGIVLADEYVTDRVRIEIANRLGWARSQIDTEPGLRRQTLDTARVPRSVAEGPPTHEFWQHWINLARVWAMTAGRADAGGAGEQTALKAWADDALIADEGWAPVRAALVALYDHSTLPRAEFIKRAPATVWEPLEQYGRTFWVRA